MKQSSSLRLILLVIIIMLGSMLALQAQKADSVKAAVNYAKITQNLLKMEQNGIANADMFNQIGLSYYKQGNSGKATLYFLRALRLNSNHKEAKNNLDYVINRSLDRELYAQNSFLSNIFKTGFDFFSLNALAIIVLIMLIAVILCLHWLLQLSSVEDKAVPVMWLVIAGFFFLFSTTLLGLKYKEFHTGNQAVVIEPELEGYSGPGVEYGKLFTVHSGLIVHITKNDKEWAMVSLPNGGAGWIRVSTIEKVKP